MRAAYSEMLRRIQQEGLYRAQEQQRWQAQRLAECRMEDAPDGAVEKTGETPPGEALPGERPGAGPEEMPGTAPGRAGAEPGKAPQKAPDAQQGAPQTQAGKGWTDKDLVECRGCWYWRMLDYTLDLRACWYPLLEDRLRPCRPADCYRKPGTPYRPGDPPEPD